MIAHLTQGSINPHRDGLSDNKWPLDLGELDWFNQRRLLSTHGVAM